MRDSDFSFVPLRGNPSGTRYNAAAAEQAWQRTLAFFDQRLKG